MRVHNKFKLGDTVFFLHKNQIYRNQITMIETWTVKNGTTIKYTLLGDDKYYEHHLFKTREDLLNSL